MSIQITTQTLDWCVQNVTKKQSLSFTECPKFGPMSQPILTMFIIYVRFLSFHVHNSRWPKLNSRITSGSKNWRHCIQRKYFWCRPPGLIRISQRWGKSLCSARWGAWLDHYSGSCRGVKHVNFAKNNCCPDLSKIQWIYCKIFTNFVIKFSFQIWGNIYS